MKKEDVKFYSDPDGFLSGTATYPCDTQYMKYNPLMHRYYLTPEALDYYGVNAEQQYITDNPNKLQDFISKVSKKVYEYINYKVGFRCYQIMMYRIATSPKTIYPDQYSMRKDFEQALVYQARFIIENGDSARVSRYNAESDKQSQPIKPEEDYRDVSDISPETIRTLDALNLTRWFNPASNLLPDINKY